MILGAFGARVGGLCLKISRGFGGRDAALDMSSIYNTELYKNNNSFFSIFVHYNENIREMTAILSEKIGIFKKNRG